MEFSSPRFCRTNSRHSSVPSCGQAFVETRNQRSKTIAVVELLAKLARRVFAGNPADAHAIKHAVGRIILLNKDRRVGGIEAVSEAVCVGAVAESTDLQGEKTGSWIDAAKNFHAHRHDAGTNRIHLSRGGKREIDDAIVDKGAAVGDSNDSGLAVVQVGDADHGFEWQRAMRRREFIHVVNLSVRSVPPVKRHAIPGSVAFLRVTGGSRRGSGLVFFGADATTGGVAGSSATSVERLAASAVSGGVEDGSTGGSWRRSATALRAAQPEE